MATQEQKRRIERWRQEVAALTEDLHQLRLSEDLWTGFDDTAPVPPKRRNAPRLVRVDTSSTGRDVKHSRHFSAATRRSSQLGSRSPRKSRPHAVRVVAHPSSSEDGYSPRRHQRRPSSRSERSYPVVGTATVTSRSRPTAHYTASREDSDRRSRRSLPLAYNGPPMRPASPPRNHGAVRTVWNARLDEHEDPPPQWRRIPRYHDPYGEDEDDEFYYHPSPRSPAARSSRPRARSTFDADSGFYDARPRTHDDARSSAVAAAPTSRAPRHEPAYYYERSERGDREPGRVLARGSTVRSDAYAPSRRRGLRGGSSSSAAGIDGRFGRLHDAVVDKMRSLAPRKAPFARLAEERRAPRHRTAYDDDRYEYDYGYDEFGYEDYRPRA